ncbi:hypothetical protein KR026_002311 [Drosophila bipectinata]|nr:hypothetical protein KR026_002311 [Drosophila bipectinata]
MILPYTQVGHISKMSMYQKYDEEGSLLCENMEESLNEPSSRLEPPRGPAWRIHLALLEYKHYKAARTIQRFFRGFLTRQKLLEQNEAATRIAKWWRGYKIRNLFFEEVQNLLQDRVMKFYNAKAQMIQASFRGWKTRQFLHDFQAMKMLRLQYAEDMLSQLARNLFRIKHENKLPGVYSLRESALLNRIEDLSWSFGYRFHNGRVRAAIAAKRSYINDKREEFRSAKRYFKSPYPSPDAEALIFGEGVINKEICTAGQRTFMVYENSIRDPHIKKVYENFAARRRNNMQANKENIRTLFCRDLVRRLIKKRLVTRNAEKKTMRQFLEELLANTGEYNCYCAPKLTEDTLCH